MYKINCDPSFNHDDIVKIFNTELELPVQPSPNQLPEAILNILMGTRQIREGSKPSIEYQYLTVQKIKRAIKRQATIPVVIPSGPKKPTAEGGYIDLAEFWFAKILSGLVQSVQSIYPPGVQFFIVLEDASMEIFEPDMPKKASDSYYDLWLNLSMVLGMERNIIPVKESYLTTANLLMAESNEIFEPTLMYIDALSKNNIAKAMQFHQGMLHLGWKGTLSMETLDYYYKSFGGSYPTETKSELQVRIARYLAVSYARYKLNVRSFTDDLDIMASVAKKVPGVEFSGNDRIYYRTIPLSKTKTHIPFWRARGVIEENNDYQTKLYPYNTTPEVAETTVFLSNAVGNSVKIRVDILT